MYNVFDILKTSAEKWPKQLAVSDLYGTITFGELYAQAEALRKQLAKKGVTQGTGVAIIFGNNRYFIISLFAVVGCGAVVMPVSPQLKDKEIINAISEGAMHFVLSDKIVAHLPYAPMQDCNALLLNIYCGRTERALQKKTVDIVDHPAFIRFTSGTTGKSKGVVISHRSVVERVEAANEGLCLNENDRVIWVLPMAYHFVVSIVLYVKYGVGIIVNDVFLADDILRSITTYNGTFLYAAPMHIKLLAAYKEQVQIPSLKKVISTTTSISEEVCRDFKAKYNLPVSQAYGIIEIGLPIINLAKSDEQPEALGYALPAYRVGILSDTFEELSAGEPGKLGIKGPGMFDAYLSPARLREEVLSNGWFLTGDLAFKQPDGLIVLQGREKNMINVSGNKVFPNEVEDVVNNFPGIIQSRAYSKTHKLMGEVVALDIVTEKDTEVNDEALISYCRQYLANFKVPQFIYKVQEIVMTGSGKVKRAED